MISAGVVVEGVVEGVFERTVRGSCWGCCRSCTHQNEDFNVGIAAQNRSHETCCSLSMPLYAACLVDRNVR